MKKLLLLLSTLVLINVYSQEKTIKLFLVKKVELQVTSYPWANELSLTLEILANSLLKDGYVRVFISYGDAQVRVKNVPIQEISKESRAYAIREVWEPINGASEEILAGKYTVTVELYLQDQTQEFVSRWNQYFTEEKHEVTKKSFEIGNKQQRQQEEDIHKKFFIEKMKNLNGLFSKLDKYKTVAAQARGNNQNPFSENGSFSKKKWWIWFNTEFIEPIQKEQKSLSIHRQQVFYPLYPYTLSAMQQYCDLLTRIGRKTAIDLYKHHRLEVDEYATQGIDLFSIQNLRDLKHLIEALHVKSAKELGISLFRELGYIPPPK